MKVITPSFQVKRHSPVPLHRQIEHYLREQIDNGQIETGEMLPSVKVLCKQFGGINHLTVRQALRKLAAEGLVKSVPGRGAFACGRSNRTHRIALILPVLNADWGVRIAHGVQRATESNGVKTLIMDSHDSSQEELNNIRQLQDLPLDGAIILPVKYADLAEQVFKLKLDGFPLILVDRYFEDIGIPAVVSDNYRGSYDLTKHLIQKGRRRLAWVGELDATSTRQRLEGFRDAISDAGLVFDRALCRTLKLATATSPFEDAIREVVKQLVAVNPCPDAIVFQNDFLALAGMDALRQLGLEIPDDIGVAGFDNMPDSARSDPPLTTVAQSVEQLGEEAAKLLLQAIEGHAPSTACKVLPVELIIRKSS